MVDNSLSSYGFYFLVIAWKTQTALIPDNLFVFTHTLSVSSNNHHMAINIYSHRNSDTIMMLVLRFCELSLWIYASGPCIPDQTLKCIPPLHRNAHQLIFNEPSTPHGWRIKPLTLISHDFMHLPFLSPTTPSHIKCPTSKKQHCVTRDKCSRRLYAHELHCISYAS